MCQVFVMPHLRRALSLVCFLGHVTAAPRQVQAIVSPADEFTCQLIANPSPLDFDAFCSADGCWPAAWLLGAQKAATTSVVDLLQVTN